MGHYHDVQRTLASSGRELRKLIPDVYAGFSALHDGAMDRGDALERKTKEMIALAVSIAEQCDGCIAAHARSLAHFGASDEEVAEAIGVAIMMLGGPGTVYGPRAWAAFTEFRDMLAERHSQAGA